jgi:uncharacterized iron-regulated membrane protein
LKIENLAKVWSRLRTALFWVHLTIGLIAALPILIMCVTGILLAYQSQIQSWIDHRGLQSHPPSPDAAPLNIENLISIAHSIRGKDPNAITVSRVTTQNAPGPVEVEWNGVPAPVYLDAYTGAIIGGPSRKAQQFFRVVATWHIGLGVPGPRGTPLRTVAGAANFLALLSVILGIFIWLPRRWTWNHLRAIALPRWGVPGRARDFNWHNALGIWSVIPLLVIFWTGTAMTYGWALRLTDRIGDLLTTGRGAGGPVSQPQHTVPSQTQPESLDGLLDRAKQQSADWKAITIFLPHQGSGPVHFVIDMSGYNGVGKASGLALARTGAVVYFTPAGRGVMSSSTFIRYGHTGEAWGVAGQTVAGLSSLGGAMLVWTGVALSLRRWRSWKARRTRQP